MSLANLIALVSTVNADPTTTPDIEEAAPTIVSVVRNGESSKSHAKGRKEAAPIHNPNAGKSTMPGLTLPERNTLDASGFLLAMRNAGKRRTAEGKPYFDKGQERNDLICAIHAYIGYDNRRDFGSQEQEARAKAQREIRGVKPITGPTREEEKRASRSVAGFVAGMPKPQQRIVLDLQARAVSLAEARDTATNEQDRALYAAQLKAANEALAELGF